MYNLHGICNEMMAGLLGLDSAENLEEIHQHDTMCKFQLIVEAINFMTILRNGCEGQYIVQIHAKCCVHQGTEEALKNVYILLKLIQFQQ